MSGARRVWFKHWIDAVGSLKLRRLTPLEERYFWWFTALHRVGKLVGVPDDEVAWEIRGVETAEVHEMRARLAKAGLLVDEHDNPDPLGMPHDFDDWNDMEDARERVRRHREKRKSETPVKRNGNGRETAMKRDGTENVTLRAEQSRADQIREEEVALSVEEPPGEEENLEAGERARFSPPRGRAPARLPSARDSARSAEWESWKNNIAATASAAPKDSDDHAPAHLVARYVAAVEAGLEAYYERRGGAFTPTRHARLAAALARHPIWCQLMAMEIYADNYSGDKEWPYIVGICRKLARSSDAEQATEQERHRKRQRGAGIFHSKSGG